MKALLSVFLFLTFMIFPAAGYSIVFVTIDGKGNHFYACEGSSGHPLSIKQIGTKKYKVLGTNIGRVIEANSEAEAAMKACGEGRWEEPKPTG